MLTVTPDAASLVRTLVEDAALSDAAGLRIETDASHRSLSMGLAAVRAAEDSTITKDDAHIFLSPLVAVRLTRRTLCAEITAVHSAFFLEHVAARRMPWTLPHLVLRAAGRRRRT